MSEKPAPQQADVEASPNADDASRPPPPPPPPASPRRHSGIRPPPPPPPPPARARASQDLTYPGALSSSPPAAHDEPLAPATMPSATTTAPLTPLPSPARAAVSASPPSVAISMLMAPPRSGATATASAPLPAVAPPASAPPAHAVAAIPAPTPSELPRTPPPAPRELPRTPPPAPPARAPQFVDPLAMEPATHDPLAGLMNQHLALPPPSRASRPPRAASPSGGVRWRAVGLAVGACMFAVAALVVVAWQVRPTVAPAATLPNEPEPESLPPPHANEALAPPAPSPTAPVPAPENETTGSSGNDSHVRTVRMAVRVAPPGTVHTAPPAGTTAPVAPTAAPAASGTTANDGTCVQRCGGHVDCIMRCPRDSIRAASQREPATPATTAAPRGDTGRGAGPTRDQVVLAMNGIRGGVLLCAMGLANAPPSARVTVTFGSSGHVLGVAVAPPFAGTPQGACIQRAVRRATLPPFERPTFQITYPFAVR